MSACQLGKGRNCREGVAHKQGNWRIFEQSETYSQAIGLFAGKAAPTGAHHTRIRCGSCGSGLAREGVRPDSSYLER